MQKEAEQTQVTGEERVRKEMIRLLERPSHSHCGSVYSSMGATQTNICEDADMSTSEELQ